MSSPRSAGSNQLVPFADRVRYMLVFRLVIAAVVAIGPVLGAPSGLARVPLMLTVAGYVAASVPSLALPRLRRGLAMPLFGIGLLADGVFLAVVSYGSAGFSSPLRLLVVLHLVVVALVGSFRTGLKVAIWHTLLLGVTYELHRAEVVVPRLGTASFSQMAWFVGVFWLLTMATATLASVNERELRRRNYDLEVLATFSWELETTTTPDGVARALVESTIDAFGFVRCMVVAAATGKLTPVAAHGVDTALAAGAPEDDVLVRTAMREHRTLRVAALDAKTSPWLAAAMPGARNVLIVPMFADGAPLGVFVAEHPAARGGRVERRVITTVERFVSQTSLALASAWLLEQVLELAATDGLTGIANRRTFEDMLARSFSRAARAGVPLGLVMVDLDHFKALNDDHGHQVGDATLQRVARALAVACRPGDVVARYGGEEFAVLLPDTDESAVRSVAERFRVAVEGVDQEPPVTASVGAASFPVQATDATELVKAADDALYESKRTGRNRVTVASPTIYAEGLRLAQ